MFILFHMQTGSCNFASWNIFKYFMGREITLKYFSQILNYFHEKLKYWVGVQQGQSYPMGRRCLFSLGWPSFSAVISVDVYLFLAFLRSDQSPWGYRNRGFLVALCYLIVRRLNLEVATKRLLHQQVKIWG